MPLTEEEKAARVKKRQEERDKLLSRISKLEVTVEEQKRMIGSYKAVSDVLDGIDLKDILSRIDEIKSGQETLKDQIRKDRGGLYISGIEDEGRDFNLIKALAGAATNWSMWKDTKEHEIMKQTTDIAKNVAGIDSEGGWFVPDQVIADVIEALYEDSVFLALDATTGRTRVSLITGLTGAKVRIPKFNSGMVAFWIGEKVPYTASEPTTAVVTLDPKKLGLLTTLTDEMATRASFGFDSLLRNDMRRVAAAEIDRVIPFGSGTNFEPRGIINDPNISQFYFENGTTTAPGGTPIGGRGDWSKMNLMMLQLENAKVTINNTAAWISSPSFFRDLANLRVLNFSSQDVEGVEPGPYLAGLPPLTMRALADLLGDFDKTTQIAANRTVSATTPGSATTYTDLFFGNWSECVVGRWGGVEILSDQGLAGQNWFADLRSIKMRMYMDIAFRHTEAILFARDVRVFSYPV